MPRKSFGVVTLDSIFYFEANRDVAVKVRISLSSSFLGNLKFFGHLCFGDHLYTFCQTQKSV